MSRDLHGINREVAGLRECSRRESAEREELLTVVSHELRTPVTIISGYNKLLLSEQVGALTDEQRRFLEESSKGCQRLDAFIGNLLEANRVAQDGEVLEIAHAPLDPVIEGVAGLLRPLLEDNDLKLELNLLPAADRASFDRTRLERILTNLIGNAIKFSPSGGTIEISTREVMRPGPGGVQRRSVEIRIADQGPGVAPEDRGRIFEPYVQVGEESQAGGLGLGLAICRRLIEAHGGSIAFEDRAGGGSVFVFDLPSWSDAKGDAVGDAKGDAVGDGGVEANGS
jgi:signal transduction histidine kinase